MLRRKNSSITDEMNKPKKQNKNVATRCRYMAQKLWPRQRRRRLTDLPVDILEHIVQMLPPYAVLSLSETCKAFRDICLEQKRRAPCSYEQYLYYLVHKSLDSLEYWVCGWCSRLHRYSLSDEPENLWATNNCPQNHLSVFRARYHAGCRGYVLQHHHVQYALRYKRFETQGRQRLLKALPWDQAIRHVTSSQNRYIDRILRPYHATIWTDMFMRHVHTAKYSAFPKIIDDMFLLKSTWTYDLLGSYGNHVRRGFLGHIVVCAHQFMTCQTKPEWVEEWKNTWKIIERYMSERDQVMGDLWGT
jgi:hypothetical protein